MSALESSITLEDVFAVVEGKRVPLAPELAGYLTLEIADGVEATGGAVDPRAVYISEEGTVALVRPKKDAADADAEASVRAILGQLLDVSGSSTPALGAAAKRKSGAGLLAFVAELEAALIPVNRAAGRRALARLAREVKRVALGVGRNASIPPPSKVTPPPPVVAEVAKAGPAPPPILSEVIEAPTLVRGSNISPPQPPPLITELVPEAGAGHPAPRPGSALFPGDEVDALLSTFEVSSGSESQMRADLKAIVGLDPSPGPPPAQNLQDLTRDVGRARKPRESPDDDVDALLALSTQSEPLAMPSRGGPSGPARTTSPVATSVPSPLAAVSAPPAKAAQVPTPEEATRIANAVRPTARDANAAPQASPPSARQASPIAKNAPQASAAQVEKLPEPARLKPIGTAFNEPRAPRTGRAILALTLFVLVIASIAVWKFSPAFFTGKRGAKPNVASASAPATPAPPPRCKASLVVSDVPNGAEVLLRMGQAPLDIERMPVGARLEFVATAEGYAPRRAVVRADATWDKTADGKSRIDVPIQLDPTKAKNGTVDPWPASEPGSQVGGSGPPGTVHVISNVRGAEVWLLAGLGPEARIEQLRCDSDIDVLLAGPSQLRKQLHVSEQDISAAPADEQGNRVVSVRAK